MICSRSRPGTAPAPARELDWSRTVEELPLAGLARELARNSALAHFDGHIVQLVVAPQFERLVAQRHIETLQTALAEALGAATRMAALSPQAHRINKRTLRQLAECGPGGPSAAQRQEHFAYADSAEHREGLAAFVDKRPPRF